MSYKNAATAEELEAVIGGDVPVAEAEHAGSADSAAQAAKVGDANVGSSTRPVYLEGGTPKQCGSTLNVGISGKAATAGTADSAAKADKLTNPRTVQVDLESEAAPNFDGSANVSPGVTGVLPVEHGGTGVASLANKSQLVLAPASATDTFHSLTPGTSGYILKSRGSGQQPQWAAPSSIAAGSATKATQDASGNTITAYYAHGLKLSVNTSTYVLTATLTNATGDTIATATIDLPLEEMVVDATFDDATDEIVLELKNGNEVRVPVGRLVAGLATTAQLNAETSARQSADTNLQNQIDDIEDGTTKVAKATTADKATQDGDGNIISSTYIKKSEAENVKTHVYHTHQVLSKVSNAANTLQTNVLSPATSSVKKGDIIIDSFMSVAEVDEDSDGDTFLATTIQGGNFIQDTSSGIVMASYAQRALQDGAGNDIEQVYAKKTELGAVFSVSATGCLTNAAISSFTVGDLLVINVEGVVDANSSAQPILTWTGSGRQHIAKVATYNGLWVSNAIGTNIPITVTVQSGGKTVTSQNLWNYRGYRIGGSLAIPLLSVANALALTEEQINAFGAEEKATALNFIAKHRR